MIKRFLALALFAVSAANAETTPYLLQQIQAAHPDTAAIAKARKQLANLRDIKLQKISLVPFHLREKQPINESNVYCTECHGSLPHLKKLRSRAFLNMHTDYIACETCHFRPEQTPLQYGWYDYNQEKIITGSSALFHSGRKNAEKTPAGGDGGKEANGLEPWQVRDGHLKIVPMLNQQVVIASRNHPDAKALYQKWKEADTERKATLKAQFHQPLQAKGLECSACHNELKNPVKTVTQVDGKDMVKISMPPLLDYAALGAKPMQQTAIRQNTIADFFSHYQTDADAEPDASATANPKTPIKEERIRITNFLK